MRKRGDGHLSGVTCQRETQHPRPPPHLTSAVTESHTAASPPCSCRKAEPANNLEITRSFLGSQALPHGSNPHTAPSRAHVHTGNTSCFNL